MIDCGEGTQLQMRKSKLKFSRLNHIFISHLHGDHCFGLIGLISTFGLMGRTADLHIHAPAPLEGLMRPWLDFFCQGLDYAVHFHPFSTREPALIYDDKSVSVTTIPLRHRIETCGFLFREKPLQRSIIREMTDFYQVPIAWMPRIKNGEDFVREDGTVIACHRLTRLAPAPRAYAYCSDTAHFPAIIPQIKGVDLLYHEATFAESDAARAKQTLHSTARQAATIAREADVKQLLIGHFSARYEDESILLAEAQTVFPATRLAQEGLTITL